jgi:hypothetical protein
VSHAMRCGQCGQRAMTNDGEEGTHALVGLDSMDLAALIDLWNGLVGRLHVAVRRPGEGLDDVELVDEVDKLYRERETAEACGAGYMQALLQAQATLWECVKITGADVSDGPPRPGTPDWPQLPELAVREVTALREQLEVAGEEAERFRVMLVKIGQALDEERAWPQGAIKKVRAILAAMETAS